jgi:DNA-binding NarL/FixJ family response regulator
MRKKIFALVDDLFFAEKIRGTCEVCEIPVVITKSADDLLQGLKTEHPGLVVIDLNGSNTQPIDTIQSIKSDPELAGFPVLGFFSHVQADLKARALQAGCDKVLPRSQLSRNLAGILREYTR